MSSRQASAGYTWPPSVMGFDMPSSSTGGGASAAMAVYLSVRPDRYWIEAFAAEAGAFKGLHRLLDMQIEADCLLVIGEVSRLRGLTLELRHFVHQVSRLSLQRKVIDRIAAEDDSARGVAENAAAQRDLERVARLPDIAAILAVVARETGMRLVAVARVSDARWTACAVHDALDYGLRAGQDLALETTICNEIRRHGQPVMFNRASEHPVYAKHHTPALYGFESYISVPILRRDGQFFGTLCAIDPKPRALDPAAVKAIEAHARDIGAEIDGVAV